MGRRWRDLGGFIEGRVSFLSVVGMMIVSYEIEIFCEDLELRF